MKAALLLLLVVLTGSTCVIAQPTGKEGDRRLLGANSEGTHFFVGFMENELYECSYSYGQRAISIASRFNTNFTITFPDGRVISDGLGAMQLRSYQVDRRYECVGEGVFNNGIEITAEHPISVYCYSSRPQTSDGYLALPTNAWGTQYVSANHGVDYYTYDPTQPGDSICAIYPRGGEFAIIAAEDNTQVTVYPTTRTYREQRSVTKVLMKGQIYQLQDGGFIRGATDLTGSVITSDKPVGLLSGHVRTGIPVGGDGKDHLIEMIPPRNELGRNYVTVPFGGRQGGDLVRIISTDPGTTTVTIANSHGTAPQVVSGLGHFIEFILTEVTVIDADKPVLVTQYSRSTSTDPRNQEKIVVKFDPDMVVVTPEEQFVNAAVFQTLPNLSTSPDYPWGTPQFEHHFVTIVAEEAKFGTMRLDGQPLPTFADFQTGKVQGTPYVWASMQVEDGMIHVLEGDALFGGYVYGLGSFDSYCWPIGAGLRKFDVTDEQPPVLSAEQDCGGFNVTAREEGPFESGLRDAWIDESYSENVKFKRVMLIIGDEFSLGYVSLDDPRKPGRARFIAEDLAGNRDTIEIELAAPAGLTFDQEEVLLADVQPGLTYRATLVVNNPNPDPITVDSLLCIIRKQFLLAASYQGKVIPPGGSLSVEILFSTLELREVHDTILVKSQCQYYRIPLRATVGAPAIGTHDLEFDTLRVGRERLLDLRVWNPGTVALHIDSTIIEGDGFSAAGLLWKPDSLLPGADTTISIRFRPDYVGDFNGIVRFYSDADSVAVAHLHGVGAYPEVSIGSYDFGIVAIGDTACALVPVTNTGGDTLHLTDVVLLEEEGFIVDRSIFPKDLGPGDTLWVQVCFVPLREHDYLADAFPQNDDGVEGQGALRGRSYQIRASLGGYDWKERWVNTEHDTVVFLRNLSLQPLTIDSVFIDESAGDPGEFKITEPLQLPLALPAGDALPVKVRFSPLLPGLRSCIIRGIGSVPGGRQIFVDSVLQGFGLIALASDVTEFDSSLAFSCGSRTGSITIYNEGNTTLTLAGIRVESSPAIVTLVDPAVAHQKIPVGESLRIEFLVDLAGYTGDVTSMIAWSFEELPDTLRRTFSLSSAPQVYGIAASVPASVGVGSGFDVNVRVEDVFWRTMPEGEVELRIEHNPRLAQFDMETWNARTTSAVGLWVPDAVPVVERPGVVVLRFRPWGADSALLDGVSFVALPFSSFLGNTRLDTFHVTMSIPGRGCVLAGATSAPYMLDSICALDDRLFELTGDGYVLKQNRPNPTGTATEIEFMLGMEASTTLELFTADGRLVRMLVQETLPAGQYDVPVDLTELPSGLYFYRLTSGPFSAVRQMMVAR